MLTLLCRWNKNPAMCLYLIFLQNYMMFRVYLDIKFLIHWFYKILDVDVTC